MNKEKTFMYELILERLLEWKTRFDEYMQARRINSIRSRNSNRSTWNALYNIGAN